MMNWSSPPQSLLTPSNCQSTFHRSSCHRLYLSMKLSAVHQPPGYIGRLQQRALGRKMGSQIPRNGNKDMTALVAVAPLVKLPYPCLEHLVGMKPSILTEKRLRERRDQCLGRMAEGEKAG